MGREVNKFIGRAATDGVLLEPQEIDEQRNGWRTDSLNDLKRDLMEVFVLRREESSQQRHGTARALDQCGFRARADLRVTGQQAIRPVTDQRGIS